MQCVILAGGLGTRLKDLSKHRPKPMVEICGKPFLEYQIEILKKWGIVEYLILTGYLAEVIEDYFGNGERFGVKIKYSREETPLGTGGALLLAKEYLDNEFMLINGDTFLPVDYTKLEKVFQKFGTEAMIVVTSNPKYKDRFNIYLNETNLITNYDKTIVGENCYVDAGIYFFKKTVLDVFPDKDVISLEMEVFGILIKKGNLAGYCIAEEFIDIGTFEGLTEFKGKIFEIGELRYVNF